MPADAYLASDMRRFGIALTTDEWDTIRKRFSSVRVPKGETIQNQARIAESWIFLTEGIAASEQTWSDGTTTIARFFEPGHICANFTSVITQDIASDDLVAMTDVVGIAIPDSLFRREYLKGGRFGEYLRLKMIDAHLFAKELVCAKTSGRTEARYQFLLRYHTAVLGNVQQKDIARFLGITPQGLSRFMRRHKSSPA